jgi:hypothetical protein
MKCSNRNISPLYQYIRSLDNTSVAFGEPGNQMFEPIVEEFSLIYDKLNYFVVEKY